MRIYVTEEDIKNGVKTDPNRCPVARAIHRATGEDWKVMPYSIEKSDQYVPAPMCVSNFVYAFDRGYSLLTKPFCFEIDLSKSFKTPMDAIYNIDVHNDGQTEVKELELVH